MYWFMVKIITRRVVFVLAVVWIGLTIIDRVLGGIVIDILWVCSSFLYAAISFKYVQSGDIEKRVRKRT